MALSVESTAGRRKKVGRKGYGQLIRASRHFHQPTQHTAISYYQRHVKQGNARLSRLLRANRMARKEGLL